MVRTDWLTVDMDGLKALLERRGKQFAIYELVQNAWDENVTPHGPSPPTQPP